jgi:hypothetical protein
MARRTNAIASNPFQQVEIVICYLYYQNWICANSNAASGVKKLTAAVRLSSGNCPKPTDFCAARYGDVQSVLISRW